MIKIKKNGFTLSEMLITLGVLGLLGILVLPGLIKDTTNKASITLLQSIISNINDTVQNELMRTKATTMADTKIYTSPSSFLNDLGAVKTAEASLNPVFYPDEGYKSISGAAPSISSGNITSAILKNGAGIGIIPALPNPHFIVDINGSKGPNIVGVDYFEFSIMGSNDYTTGQHIGDLGYIIDKTTAELKTNCSKGSGPSCFQLLISSGFDHNYMK
ncbi:MAG: prepilin-type N-terminal cleavage/methylation domain-containing protein [Candidatus Gastranaerophilales bacterium]|nr:prepilin-type N-terminal cleavage/methylation domain-containing protein [Candidatus Gastranaerophilales bacterium]